MVTIRFFLHAPDSTAGGVGHVMFVDAVPRQGEDVTFTDDEDREDSFSGRVSRVVHDTGAQEVRVHVKCSHARVKSHDSRWFKNEEEGRVETER